MPPIEGLSVEARIAILDSQLNSIVKTIEGLDRIHPSVRDLGSVEQRVAILETEVDAIKAKIDKKIEKAEFWPIRVIVYGLAGVVLLAVATALLSGLNLGVIKSTK